ncbi:cytochrome P450 [Lojkania enalia]|uniref:Cytochrome P450 n=1 Tax=Lojkania enalia TaxID=147567 RepID=A0A9P4KJ04_9PLEO|nr:cytochrome P450 [Didymosphaeria enalia]
MLSPITIVFATAFLFSFCRLLLQLYSSTKQNIPGPFFARLTRLWYLKKVRQRNFHETNIKLHKKYGPIVRIAPNEFSVDDPEAIKVIYGHGTNFNKSPWYYASGHPVVPDLFTDRNARTHAILRRKVASLYSMTTLLHMEPCVNECTILLTERFREFAHHGTTINLQHWLQCYAFDLIGLITVAKRFGFLNDGHDPHNLFPALHAYLQHCADVGIYSEFHPLIHKLQSLLKRGNPVIRNFTTEQIDKRIGEFGDVEKKPGIADDFLAKTLQKNAEDPEGFTMQEVFLTCLTNIGAGSDTTSISLCAVFWFLLKNPDSFAKLRAEIDNSGIDQISFQDAQKLPYMQAVIKEAMRVHPVTGLPLGRVVPKGGATIAGKHLPEGSVVGVNTWVAHNNTQVFGSDAATFNPDRWLQSEESTKSMDRYYLPFGHGSRTCIGKNISLMEISVLVPALVRKFDFELVDPGVELQCENIWFVKQKNVFCKVRMRDS